MTKLVKVISVDHDVVREKKDGGTYKCTVFAYEDAGQVKSTSIASSFLANNAKLLQGLNSLVPGEFAELTFVKNGNFFNLTEVKASGADSSMPASPARGSKFDTFKGRGGGDPTDTRQESIVFQNSMAHATALAIHNSGGKPVYLEQVFLLAKEIAKVSINPAAADIRSTGGIPQTGHSTVSEDTAASQVSPDVPGVRIVERVPFGD